MHGSWYKSPWNHISSSDVAIRTPFELHYGRSSIGGKDIAYYTASLANSPQDARGVRSTTLYFLAALLVVVMSYSGREEAARCYDVGT